LSKEFLSRIEKYYSNKVRQHGESPLGVDWNSLESQYLRFEQLSKVINEPEFSILDFGCGFGEYVNYLKMTLSFNKINYTGFDISDEMVKRASQKFREEVNVNFLKIEPTQHFDYVTASGIFNVKFEEVSNQVWKKYILETIGKMNNLSKKGFSFNCLTKYSDKEFMKDYLYYADPLEFFDYCKKNFSRNIALLHDYGLYEFTIIIRK